MLAACGGLDLDHAPSAPRTSRRAHLGRVSGLFANFSPPEFDGGPPLEKAGAVSLCAVLHTLAESSCRVQALCTGGFTQSTHQRHSGRVSAGRIAVARGPQMTTAVADSTFDQAFKCVNRARDNSFLTSRSKLSRCPACWATAAANQAPGNRYIGKGRVPLLARAC